MKKYILGSIIISLGLFMGLVMPSGAAEAHHRAGSPGGVKCQTVTAYGWYSGGPSAIIAHGWNDRTGRPVLDSMPLPSTIQHFGSGFRARISFAQYPNVWIRWAEFAHVGPHWWHVNWSDCK